MNVYLEFQKKIVYTFAPLTPTPDSVLDEVHTSNNNKRRFLGEIFPFDVILATI